VQYEYFSRLNDVRSLAESCVKFRRQDVLQELDKRIKNEADRQHIKDALAKL
jgi:hypothetical protein